MMLLSAIVILDWIHLIKKVMSFLILMHFLLLVSGFMFMLYCLEEIWADWDHF
jgi:hypothetical protein